MLDRVRRCPRVMTRPTCTSAMKFRYGFSTAFPRGYLAYIGR